MAGFTYSFVDKDPIIDEIRTVVSDSGATYTYISATSGVSKTTLTNWFSGSTKRPQAASVNAVLRALGYRLAIVQFATQTEQPQALIVPRAETRHAINMVPAEAIFSMLSRVLPIENLQVEEVAPIPLKEHGQAHVPSKSKIAHAPLKTGRVIRRRKSKGLALDAGINRIIMQALSDGKPYRAAELEPLLAAEGYSAGSVGSRMQALKEHKVIQSIGHGQWILGHGQNFASLNSGQESTITEKK